MTTATSCSAATACKLALVGAAFAAAIPAAATETITYTYDAHGLLPKVVRTGNVNNNIQTTITIDKADNRSNVTTTGAS